MLCVIIARWIFSKWLRNCAIELDSIWIGTNAIHCNFLVANQFWLAIFSLHILFVLSLSLCFSSINIDVVKLAYFVSFCNEKFRQQRRQYSNRAASIIHIANENRTWLSIYCTIYSSCYKITRKSLCAVWMKVCFFLLQIFLLLSVCVRLVCRLPFNKHSICIDIIKSSIRPKTNWIIWFIYMSHTN